MTWTGQHPEVDRIEGDYPTGVIVPKTEMKLVNQRLERSAKLPKYDSISEGSKMSMMPSPAMIRIWPSKRPGIASGK